VFFAWASDLWVIVNESGRILLLPNVRDDGSPLAFGADPASAGSVTKVPKAW